MCSTVQVSKQSWPATRCLAWEFGVVQRGLHLDCDRLVLIEPSVGAAVGAHSQQRAQLQPRDGHSLPTNNKH